MLCILDKMYNLTEKERTLLKSQHNFSDIKE